MKMKRLSSNGVVDRQQHQNELLIVTRNSGLNLLSTSICSLHHNHNNHERTFHHSIIWTLSSILVTLILLFDINHFVRSFEIKSLSSSFEAAFQGECRKSSPCQQLCFDLHDGTFECACNQGYHLDINGYSCIINTDDESSPPSVGSSTNSLLISSKKSKNNKIQASKKNFSDQTSSLSSYSTSTLAVSNSFRSTVVSGDPPFTTPISSQPVRSSSSSSSTSVNNDDQSLSSSSPSLYSCNDIECEAGGVCMENPPTISNQQQRVRCKCPLGRGGQFCEKIIEVKQPRFMGSSYLALPTLRNAHRSLKINIEFKPESFDGVLLYSGQETNLDGDFIAIILNQGFVEFLFDCGMGEGIIRSEMPIILNSWNTINIYRDGRNAWMQVNQAQQIFGHSKGLFSRITFRLETFLGGSPNISQIENRIKVNNGLIGCVRQLKINDRNYDLYNDTIDGIDIEQCNADACNHVTCLNGGHCAVNENNIKQCICPLGFIGEFCETQIQFSMPSFNGSSHLQFIGFGEKETLFTEIYMAIKPLQPDGLFLYNGQKMDQTGDFISLNLVDGYVEFRFDLGSGAAILRSSEKIAMKEWHTIFATRTGREGYLQVDDQPGSYGQSLGAFTQLSLPLNLYIGGVPSLRDIHHNVRASQLYRGCIQRLIINGHQVSLLEDVLSGVNIDNCQHNCQTRPCLNNGICEPLNHHYRCHCPSNNYFIGQHCEKETETGFESYPMFYGNSFLKYSDQNILNRICGFKTIIHLNLRAFSSSGLILWFGETLHRSSDYFTIGLNDGHVNVDVNLGGGTNSRFTLNGTRVDDGQWHQLDVVRIGRQILIRIDHSNSATIRGFIQGEHNQLNVQSALYLGGLEDTAMITNDYYNKGFIGCISNMTLNQNYHVDLMADSDRGINIRTCI